ncbi:MAG: multidrug effflux MFS transporter [Hyphomicrobiales bacterium]
MSLETPVSAPEKPLSTVEFIALFSLITSLTAASIDGMLPALGVIGLQLGAPSHTSTQLVISLFIFGMVFGELIFGPLSDAIGRRKTILIGLAIFCAGTIVAMTAQSMEQMFLGRVIQGIGVSGPKIGSRALVRDKFSGDAMARIMSYIYMVFVLVPMLAPALGQLIMNAADWRAIFVVYLLMGIVVSVWLMARQAETLILERRVPLAFRPLTKNAGLILKHKRTMAYILALGIVFGGKLLYLSTAQSIFQDIYGVGSRFPLYFAMLAFGIGVASFSNSQLVMRYGMERLSIFALCSMCVLATCLLTLTLWHEGQPPFLAFMIICGFLFFCFAILFSNLNAMAMQNLGRIAGLGASMVSSGSSMIAVVIAVSFGTFYQESVVPLSLAFLFSGTAGLSLVLCARRTVNVPV